jgi:hypothetical protein
MEVMDPELDLSLIKNHKKNISNLIIMTLKISNILYEKYGIYASNAIIKDL